MPRDSYHVGHSEVVRRLARQQAVADRCHRLGIIPVKINVADQVWKPTGRVEATAAYDESCNAVIRRGREAS